MSTSYLPSTEEIALLFTDELRAIGGSVSESYDDGSRLFIRALLPKEGEVRPGDPVSAGVALRAMGPVVEVCPYTLRRVCTNGAVAAHVKHGRGIRRVENPTATEFVAAATDEIRLAIHQCAAPEAFTTVLDEMRLASTVAAQLMIQALPMLARQPNEYTAELVRLLSEEFARANDETLYGVMNAITAVARETRDPDERWRLEVYGGSIPARAPALLRRPTAPAEEVMAV